MINILLEDIAHFLVPIIEHPKRSFVFGGECSVALNRHILPSNN